MRARQDRKFPWKELLLLAALNTLLLLPMLLGDGVIINRDFHFPVFTDNFIEYHVPTWNSYMSQPNIEQLVRLPLRLPFLGLAKLGVGVPVILKLLILCTAIFVTGSFFLFIRELFHYNNWREHKAVPFVAALLFVFAPATLQFSWEVSLLFSLGALPLLLYVALRYAHEDDAKMIVFGALAILLSTGHPFILVMNIGIFLLFILLFLPFKYAVRQFFGTVLLAGLLLSYFALPYVSQGTASSVDLGRTQHLQRNIFEQVSDNQFYRILLLERDKFNYIQTTPDDSLPAVHHVLALLTLFVLAAALLLTEDWRKHESDRKIVTFAVVGYLVVTIISYGAKSLLGEVYFYYISSLPLGWVVRSPLKFQLYQVFFLVLAVTLSLQYFISYLESRGRRGVLVAGSVAAAVLLIGAVGYGIYDANVNSMDPIPLPDGFYGVNVHLKEQPDHKVLWYPRYQELPTYWSHGHRIAPFDMKSSQKPTYNTYLNYEYVVSELYTRPYVNNSFKDDAFYRELSMLDVSHIAFHDDRNLSKDDYILSLLQKNTRQQYASGDWYLFELPYRPRGEIYILNGSTINDNSTDPQVIADGDTGSIMLDDTGVALNDGPAEPTVRYEKLSPTHWRGNATLAAPATIVFAESYSPDWEAQVKYGTGEVEVIEPDLQFGVINSFNTTQAGEVTIDIYYKPDFWFRVGAVISTATLMACIGYLVFRRKRGPGDTEPHHASRPPSHHAQQPTHQRHEHAQHSQQVQPGQSSTHVQHASASQHLQQGQQSFQHQATQQHGQQPHAQHHQYQHAGAEQQ